MAIVHDVIEDMPVTAEELRQEGFDEAVLADSCAGSRRAIAVERRTVTLWFPFRGEIRGGSQSHVTRAPVCIPRPLELRGGRRVWLLLQPPTESEPAAFARATNQASLIQIARNRGHPRQRHRPLWLVLRSSSRRAMVHN